MTEEVPLAYRSRVSNKSDQPAPAVVLIHGRGADERDLLPIATQLPDELAVFSVRGPIKLDDGYAWYDIDVDQGGLHNSQPDSQSFRQSIYRLGKFIELIVSKYNIDRSRIGLLGFSQGGTLAMASAPELADRVAWVVALSGYLPEEYRSASKLIDARDIPMFLGAGEMDLVIPDERTERASTRLRDVGIDVTYRTYRVGHGASDKEIEDAADWIRRQMS